MSGLLGKSNLGGGVEKVFATISVTYPVGSICTCVNGTKTLKAKGTSGSFMFLVPFGGVWTISITNGEKISSKNINIENRGAYTIELYYALYIFKTGSGLQNGFTAESQSSSWGYDINDERIVWGTTANVGGDVTFVPAGDFSGFTKLCFETDCYDRWGSTYSVKIGLGKDKTISYYQGGTFEASVNYYEPGVSKQVVDISNVGSTPLYVKLLGFAVRGEIRNVWLE